jgi:hypothetical protein
LGADGEAVDGKQRAVGDAEICRPAGQIEGQERKALGQVKIRLLVEVSGVLDLLRGSGHR